MYLQKVISRKNCIKNQFFAGILKVNDENSRIRIQNPDPGSGSESGSICQRHGSADPEIDSQIYTKYCTTLSQNKSSLFQPFLLCTNLNQSIIYAIFVRIKSVPYNFKLAKQQKFKISKSQKRQVRKSQKRKVSNKLFKSANLKICNLRNLFADRPPLDIY